MMRILRALAFVLVTATPAAAVPLVLPEPGHLVAPACLWTVNLATSPGPFTVGCRVERASIAAVDPNVGGPVGQPETPGGRLWFTVESQGRVWQEERWAKGWDTERFAVPDIQGRTRITFATERELRMYDFFITQPEPELAHTPEPATLALLGVSAAVVGWRMRRGAMHDSRSSLNLTGRRWRAAWMPWGPVVVTPRAVLMLYLCRPPAPRAWWQVVYVSRRR